MKVTTARLPEARMVLEVEVDAERLQQSLDRAYRNLAPRARIPGFRPGKAPRPLVERHLGREALFQEAMDLLVPEAYDEAVREHGIEPIGAPDLEILTLDPVRFKATVPLRPEVDLGDYRTVALARDPVEIAESDVEETILALRRAHAILEPVGRPVQENDHLVATLTATVDGETILNEPRAEFAIRAEDQIIGLPGVRAQILGMPPGVEKTFDITVPDDHPTEALRGKMARFTVTVAEIKQENLPDPDDDLSAEVGDFPTFAALRERIEHGLRARAEQNSQQAFHDQVLNAVIGKATVEFPPQLVDHEVDHLLQEIAQQQGHSLPDYLSRLGASAAQLRQIARPQAQDRVLRSLVLDAAAAAENVTVDEADIDAEVTRLTADSPNAEQVRALFETPNGRDAIRQNLRVRRTLDRLARIATENAAADAAPLSPGAAAPAPIAD